MEPISDYMTRHHQECDEVFSRAEEMASAADWAGLERSAGEFLREMERHFELEEALLFPAFEDRTGMRQGPTATMLREHAQMRELFAQMRAAVDAKDADAYLGLTETLLFLMQQHNMKEEGMMYPMLDQALGDDASDLLNRIQAVTA